MFNGFATGDAAADFMLGNMNNLRMVGVLSNNLDQTNWQFFGSDEIKVTPRLTVTLGMRWQPDLHFTEASGKESSFRPGLQSTVFPNAPLGLLFKGDSQLPSNVISPNWHNFAPRISFAYDVFGTGKTAVRGGYGIFYDDFASIRLNRFPLIQPYVLDTTVFDVPLADPYQGKGPYPFIPPTTAAAEEGLPVRPAGRDYVVQCRFPDPLRPAVEFQYPTTVALSKVSLPWRMWAPRARGCSARTTSTLPSIVRARLPATRRPAASTRTSARLKTSPPSVTPNTIPCR